MNKNIKIELIKIPQGWIARIAGDEDYEAGPMPTAHEALEDVARLLRQFYEAFSVLKE